MIRKYSAADREDVELLLRLGLEEQERHAAASIPPENEEFFETEWAEHIAGLDAEPEAWSVATDASAAILGCLWLRTLRDPLGPYRSVREIVVAPKARGRGIGTALLMSAEAEARASDAVMLLISALKSNPAVRLYRRLGFVDLPGRFRADPNPNHVVLWKNFKNVPGAI